MSDLHAHPYIPNSAPEATERRDARRGRCRRPRRAVRRRSRSDCGCARRSTCRPRSPRRRSCAATSTRARRESLLRRAPVVPRRRLLASPRAGRVRRDRRAWRVLRRRSSGSARLDVRRLPGAVRVPEPHHGARRARPRHRADLRLGMERRDLASHGGPRDRTDLGCSSRAAPGRTAVARSSLGFRGRWKSSRSPSTRDPALSTSTRSPRELDGAAALYLEMPSYLGMVDPQAYGDRRPGPRPRRTARGRRRSELARGARAARRATEPISPAATSSRSDITWAAADRPLGFSRRDSTSAWSPSCRPSIWSAVPTVRAGEHDFFWGNFESTSYETRGHATDFTGCSSALAGIVAATYLYRDGAGGYARAGRRAAPAGARTRSRGSPSFRRSARTGSPAPASRSGWSTSARAAAPSNR